MKFIGCIEDYLTVVPSSFEKTGNLAKSIRYLCIAMQYLCLGTVKLLTTMGGSNRCSEYVETVTKHITVDSAVNNIELTTHRSTLQWNAVR